MNVGELYARLHQMREAAQTIGQGAESVQRSIDVIESEIRALGSDRFMSVGAEAFRAEYARMTPRLRAAFDLLGGFREKLNGSADDIELAARTVNPGGSA
jgi:uncharacterized protein YukE